MLGDNDNYKYPTFEVKDLLTRADLVDIQDAAKMYYMAQSKHGLVEIYCQAVIDVLARKRLIQTNQDRSQGD